MCVSRNHFEDVADEAHLTFAEHAQRRHVFDELPEGALRFVVEAARRLRHEGVDLLLGHRPIPDLVEDLLEQEDAVPLHAGRLDGRRRLLRGRLDDDPGALVGRVRAVRRRRVVVGER